MRYAARVDANQDAVVSALRAAGASVYILKLPVDLLVGHVGKTALVEVKDPNSSYGRKGLNENQRKFKEGWMGGTLAVVDGPEAALRLLKVMEAA